MGNSISQSQLQDCKPIIQMKDVNRFHQDITWNQKANANPCGLVATSFFNDTFSLKYQNLTQIEINEQNISWERDRNKGFNNNKDQEQWTDVENCKCQIEHFIVQMKASGQPVFRKLWGILEDGLDQGNYTVLIQTNFRVKEIGAERYVVFSTSTNFGGKNFDLAYAFVFMGALLGSVFFVVLVKEICRFRKYGK